MIRLPVVTPSEIVKALKRAGFVERHQKGSHLFMWNEYKKRMTTVALHAKDMPRPMMKEILKQAGITEEKFRDLL